MKKILTLAIVAFLMGGFAFNASAQTKPAKAQEKKEVKQQEDWTKVIKEFESQVDQCVTVFQKLKKAGGKDEGLTKEFNAALAKAEKTKNKIEKAKKDLNRTQVDRYNKACNKLSQVYAK